MDGLPSLLPKGESLTKAFLLLCRWNRRLRQIGACQIGSPFRLRSATGQAGAPLRQQRLPRPSEAASEPLLCSAARSCTFCIFAL
jgi:hypothetical protein